VALGATGVAVLLALAHTANDAVTAIVAVLLPTLQAKFDLSATTLAVLVAGQWVTSSITQPFLGALADRVSRRALAAGGIVLNAALLSLVGVVPTVPLLFAVIVVGGLGSAALHPIASAIAHHHGGTRAGLGVGLFSAGGQIGAALGPVAVLAVVATLGLQGTLWLMVPGLLLGIAVWRLLPPDQPPGAIPGPRSCLRCLAHGPVALLAVGGMFADLAFVSFTSAIPLWLVHERGLPRDDPTIAATLGAFALGAGLGAVAAGWLDRRVDRRILVPATMIAAIAPLVAVLHLPPGGLLGLGAATLAGALVYANFPLMIVSAQALAPHSVAAASGMLMGLATGVAGVLYIPIGKLQELIGITGALTVAYLSLVPAALLALLVLTRHLRDGTPSPLLADRPRQAHPGPGD
jgi:FSR family fosmidomycin resistance protein-like MFS transporter